MRAKNERKISRTDEVYSLQSSTLQEDSLIASGVVFNVVQFHHPTLQVIAMHPTRQLVVAEAGGPLNPPFTSPQK